MRARGVVFDLAIAAAVIVVCALLALHFVRAVSLSPWYFFDWELVPAAMMACGRGSTRPAEPVAALSAFVARRAAAFDCAALPPGLTLHPPGSMALANRYGLVGPAISMWLGGVNWPSIDRYVAFLFGVVMALTYGLMRQAATRPFALLGTALLATSNKLQEVLLHRDFIKEPPFLALLLLVVWIVVRDRSRRQSWLASIAGGVLLGIGIGCRIDLLVIGPFFLLALLAFVRWPDGAAWRNRAVAVVLFVAGFAVTGLPILRTLSGGSNLGHHVLLGFMTPFTRGLGLVVPVYDVGHEYSDGYAYTLIAAQARVREGDRGAVPFGEAPYDRAGARLNRDIVIQFPADAVARAYGAILQALAYPFSREAIAASAAMAGFSSTRGITVVAESRARVMSWFAGTGVWLTAAAILGVAAFDLRLGAFCVLAIAYFCSYSMLQFQRRHTFHLDVFAMVAAMFLLQVVATGVWSRVRRGERHSSMRVRPIQLRNAAVFVVVTGGLAVALLAAARWHQQRHVATLIDATIQSTNVPVPLMVTEIDPTDRLVSGAALGQRIGPGPIDDVRDVRMDYLVAEFGGRSCGANVFEVRLKYSGVVHTIDKEFDRPFLVSPRGDERFRVLTPAFYEYGPYWLRFDGIVVPNDRIDCLTGLFRAERPGSLPFPFLYAALGPGWTHSALYQRFAWE